MQQLKLTIYVWYIVLIACFLTACGGFLVRAVDTIHNAGPEEVCVWSYERVKQARSDYMMYYSMMDFEGKETMANSIAPRVNKMHTIARNYCRAVDMWKRFGGTKPTFNFETFNNTADIVQLMLLEYANRMEG